MQNSVIKEADGWLLNDLVAVAWGSVSMALGGVISSFEFAKLFVQWFLGDLVVIIVLTPLLLKYLTPIIRRAGLANPVKAVKGGHRSRVGRSGGVNSSAIEKKNLIRDY